MTQMKHIDVYLLHKYHKELWPFIDRFFILLTIKNKCHIPPNFTDKDIERALSQDFNKPPKMKYLVHALKEKGLSQGYIANLLDTTQSNVSYHLQKPLTSEYKNIGFQYFLDPQEPFDPLRHYID